MCNYCYDLKTSHDEAAWWGFLSSPRNPKSPRAKRYWETVHKAQMPKKNAKKWVSFDGEMIVASDMFFAWPPKTNSGNNAFVVSANLDTTPFSTTEKSPHAPRTSKLCLLSRPIAVDERRKFNQIRFLWSCYGVVWWKFFFRPFWMDWIQSIKLFFIDLVGVFVWKSLTKYYEACMDLCMLSMLSTIQTTLEVVLRHCSELEMSNHWNTWTHQVQ